MIEILKSFEQAASRFDPSFLMVPGLVMVALGLITWLAGMCLRRLMLALAGAAVGGTAGWLLKGQNPTIVALAAGGGMILGAALPRWSAAVLLAAFGAAAVFAITARPQAVAGQTMLAAGQNAGTAEKRLTVPQSLDVTRVFVLDMVDHTRSVARAQRAVDLAIVAVAGIGLLGLGLLLVRLTGALVFSVLGTALIFAGLIVLLIFKGSAPITLVEERAAFYGLVLLGMAAFGTLEQLVLCPSPKRRTKAEPGASRSRREESEHHWRNH